MLKYNNFAFLFPPRPDGKAKIPSTLLGLYEQRGWVAQVKKNGTNNVIFVPPNGKLIAMTRDGDEHKQWNWTAKSGQIFRDVADGKTWNVFVAELLHNKNATVKDTNYVHDVLVYRGEYLLGTTYRERQELLHRTFDRFGGTETRDYRILNPNTWLATCHKQGFRQRWDTINEAAKRAAAKGTSPMDEGLVCKNLDGVLRAKDNNGWLVKCRVLHKNYSC
jgi:hypothetical protein